MFNRPQSPSTQTLLTSLFGFDPSRLLGSVQTFGFDVQRTDSGYRLEVAAPGYKPEDIKVTVENGQLTVQGKTPDGRQFTRQLVLTDDIDQDKIQATVDHGLLTLTLPFHAKVQPRTIQVQVGAAAAPGNGQKAQATS